MRSLDETIYSETYWRRLLRQPCSEEAEDGAMDLVSRTWRRDPKACHFVRHLLRSSNRTLREFGASVVEELGRRSVQFIDHFPQMLVDRSPYVRWSVLDPIVCIPQRKCRPLMHQVLRLLSDRSRSIRSRAAEVIAKKPVTEARWFIRRKEMFDDVRLRFLAECWHVSSRLPDSSSEAKKLVSSRARWQRITMLAASLLNRNQAAPVIALGLQHSDVDTRFIAADLAGLATANIVPALLSSISNEKDPDVVGSAVSSLKQLVARASWWRPEFRPFHLPPAVRRKIIWLLDFDPLPALHFLELLAPLPPKVFNKVIGCLKSNHLADQLAAASLVKCHLARSRRRPPGRRSLRLSTLWTLAADQKLDEIAANELVRALLTEAAGDRPHPSRRLSDWMISVLERADWRCLPILERIPKWTYIPPKLRTAVATLATRSGVSSKVSAAARLALQRPSDGARQ